MSSSEQEKLIEAAIDAVQWAELASLSEQDIRRRWRDDREANWPGENELKEFLLVDADASKKPPQAAE